MQIVCVYAKRASSRKSLAYVMGRWPDVMRVGVECRNLDECKAWLKMNKANSLVAISPPTSEARKKYERELKRKFPKLRISVFTARRIRQLVELYEFYDYSEDRSLPRPKRVPPLFPKVWLKSRVKAKRILT